MINLIRVINMILKSPFFHTNQINHSSDDELLSESQITRIKGFHGWVAEDAHSHYPELSER